MKGPYDDKLDWLLRGMFKVELLDQVNIVQLYKDALCAYFAHLSMK